MRQRTDKGRGTEGIPGAALPKPLCRGEVTPKPVNVEAGASMAAAPASGPGLAAPGTPPSCWHAGGDGEAAASDGGAGPCDCGAGSVCRPGAQGSSGRHDAAVWADLAEPPTPEGRLA